ncbi:DUF2167 domain-containing protein [Tuwongella immobilis]|uniref:DUF2167 domain-containing protein n=1 Tax=Tuwongella immobilis TaxID=692036 RepID=A0A6C2YSG4_9BACT|nr:DUF2167 domain-containing protein [Tuwongella immobilis]VIP04628.1 Uncharacterized protein OS=Granulicella mallensis (strain ATCC BAA-1857 / DSM 23137 / MP5ACTX8) GN=AciX8_4447 PE=4 SV=1: DUF2167 [Tuwongella immobilis]VTS06617.1 Uncharacterized protein OS=Granulicella mallensis (strain ATCC BAA-1857 / DSM 23137 / MP5ACTX8) GN=AciX8_4447 PE=4 SV=1: DUF2167 [Tuwongella immobilis]
MTWRNLAGLALFGMILAPTSVVAQPAGEPGEGGGGVLAQMMSLSKPGPMKATLRDIATIDIPKGYRFVPESNMRAFNSLFQNTTSGSELGAILPDPKETFWFLVFDWTGDGYVKDDERDKLDAAAILKSRQEMQEADNNNRAKQGWAKLEIPGWSKEPFYDPETNNLTWGLRVRDLGAPVSEESVNYESKLLGRRGYVSAVLVGSAEEVNQAIPAYKSLLKNFSYNGGQRYTDFQSGDKIAEYGLTALAAGGILALAAKSGLLGKLLKPLIAVGVLIIAGISSVFKKIFGGGNRDA